jgi:hypothetical protein
LNVVGEGPKHVVRQRLHELAPAFGEAMPSYEERLIERGRREGRQESKSASQERMSRSSNAGTIERSVPSTSRRSSPTEEVLWDVRSLDRYASHAAA